VHETLHTREAWRVDYYLLHTGEVEPATMMRDDDRGLISFVKLIRSEDVITCVDCYGNPRVRSEREDRFRPERRLEAVG
jgi:hypothetical protein